MYKFGVVWGLKFLEFIEEGENRFLKLLCDFYCGYMGLYVYIYYIRIMIVKYILRDYMERGV